MGDESDALRNPMSNINLGELGSPLTYFGGNVK